MKGRLAGAALGIVTALGLITSTTVPAQAAPYAVSFSKADLSGLSRLVNGYVHFPLQSKIYGGRIDMRVQSGGKTWVQICDMASDGLTVYADVQLTSGTTKRYSTTACETPGTISVKRVRLGIGTYWSGWYGPPS